VNILLVGAGAVGQVYGHHLKEGGARVSFFVRPKAAAAARGKMVLYPLRRREERTPVIFEADAVFTSTEEIAAAGEKQRWDEVWFCVPANALDEAWLASIAAAVGDARVVALPPGLTAEEKIRRAFPGREIVPGLIGIMSYQAPLPGEEVPEPGIAYWCPPGSPTAFGGPRGAEVAEELDRGGCPAVAKKDVGATSALGGCVLMPTVAALEAAGWSFAEFRRGEMPQMAAAAAREALAITAARLDVGVPFFAFFVRGWVLRLVAWLAPWFVPTDLEAFLRHHFKKVGEQTRLLFADFRKDGKERGMKTDALEALEAKLV
jgi:2-dehydropantoate 2-reductase